MFKKIAVLFLLLCIVSISLGVPSLAARQTSPASVADTIVDGNITSDTTWSLAGSPYHITANPGGLGDSVSDYVDFDPWLSWPVDVEEQPIVGAVETYENLNATVFRGPLHLPEGKTCKVYDITGRAVEPTRIQSGIYFIEVDGVVTQKVVKVR